MKHLSKVSLCVLVCSMFFIACRKDEVKEDNKDKISQNIISQIKGQGFNTNEIRRVKDGYVVEGDIFLSDKSLSQGANGKKLLIAKSEQYRTNNLISISGQREITISVTNLPPAYVAAADEAIARYNALGLRLTFRRIASGGNVDIINANLGWGILGQSAGFPDAQGNPPSPIKLNASYIGNSPNQAYMATIIAHEIGHTIGLRHTDYFNRAYSCGSGGNEGDAGVGAINIPGTPTAADPNSWMLACVGTNVNRPFNANDIIALRYLYGQTTTGNPIPDGTYKIVSVGSGKVVDVDANYIYNDGAKVQQWTWLGHDNQKWTFTYLGNGYYKIISVGSGKSLDVDANFINSDGAKVQQWTWGGNQNQQWIVRPEANGSYAIVSKPSGKVLDIDANNINNDGAQIQQWTWLNGGNQRWYIQRP
ncbi:MAG TPA: M57 family metalloprotease [Chitinophaga sp.]|uniref:M57 family metalloprotease n=1 Tax=Chitinophaga sp. TaxID=1869181 RepID=UPI002D0CD4D4|nr:M57 family metalloprotease [Chitinophaga sp.]HVI44512.1 M57 family metalloprotease [Chitinophaga sp.]